MPESMKEQPPLAGLTTAAAAKRLALDGYNELPTPGRRGFLRIFGGVLREPMFALLIGGGIIYLLLGSRSEALLLLLFASLSAGIALIQESRSENVLAALRNLASPRALVIRDGKRILIAGRDLVCGDLIVVAEGDRVAADATLVSAQDLLLDESLLTGESVPVRKLAPAAGAPGKDSAALAKPGGEDLPALFAGTLVVRGSGSALVTATGLRSEMGKIGKALEGIETEQPRLQVQIRGLVRVFAIVGALAGLVVVVLFGLLRGSWLEAMLGGIALGMSLLPEEFPLILAVFMAMGAWRISRVRVLTRHASAIETLGATTVLCTDKTGTLTENRMSIIAIVDEKSRWNASSKEALSGPIGAALNVALLACPREPSDPMDLAIHQLAQTQTGANAASFAGNTLIRAYGLRPDLLAVTNVMIDAQGQASAYAKGALEAIATLCRLPADRLATIRVEVDALANDGIRVLCIARAKLENPGSPQDLPETPRDFDFAYLGLIGFADPLRQNVADAVAECRNAGIRVVMITGDYPATARAIGKQAGIDATDVLSGDEIDALSDEQLALRVSSTSIHARIRPAQKLRIVQSLKRNGEIVAMTGDGVNDAPAIKAANIGIAMGGRGTDVAREASAIVLLDDDFGSIVKTIRLGRRIYDNLRKAIEFTVAVHIPIAGLAILPLLLGLPLILTPIHIAFLEMVIDPACSVVFEAEPAEDDVMQRPPRDPTSPLLQPRRILWAIIQGSVVLVILACAYIAVAGMDVADDELRALVFSALVVTNTGLILVNRSFKSSLLRALIRPNRSLWILVGGIAVLLATALSWPPAQSLFHFGPLHGSSLALSAAIGLFSLLLLEAIKSQWFSNPNPRLSSPA